MPYIVETPKYLSSSGMAASKVANATSISTNGTNTYTGNDLTLILVFIAVDNFDTTDTSNAAVTSVTDTAGNTYTRVGGYTNGQGAAQAGATVDVWKADFVYALTGTTVWTANFNNNTYRDAASIDVRGFRADRAGKNYLYGDSVSANDNTTTLTTLNVVTDGRQILRVRAVATEYNNSIFATTGAPWDYICDAYTSGGSATTNIGVGGEFVISTDTSLASQPTLASAADSASYYFAMYHTAQSLPPVSSNIPPALLCM